VLCIAKLKKRIGMSVIPERNLIFMALSSLQSEELAYTTWGLANVGSATLYITIFSVFGGMAGVEMGAFFALAVAILSLPALLPLRLLLPKLVLLKSRSHRQWAVAILISITFLALALPTSFALDSTAPHAQQAGYRWHPDWVLLTFGAPCWLSAMVATAYTCRHWLFERHQSATA
jgi:hypothetical protein